MATLTLAAAQSISVAGDIAASLASHVRLAQAAVAQGVQLLVFPELSLTGYELALAAELAIEVADERLDALEAIAREHSMLTVVGAPLSHGAAKPLIAALVLGLPGGRQAYAKRHLHTGEDQFVAAGEGGAPLHVGGLHIALAVCADFGQASHARGAALAGADVYAVGALIGEGGYAHDSGLLSGYALEHRMAVLMANHGGETGGWRSAGRSAIWAPDGRLLAAAGGPGEQLVVARCSGGQWQQG